MTTQWRLTRYIPRALLYVTLLVVPIASPAAGPMFESPPERDSAGFFRLKWSGAERYELEQATGPDHDNARIIYRGGDSSTTVSGLSDGSYRFRIREQGAQDWHDETVVVVEHHPLSRAFLFFALGAVVFLVLILAIARGRKLA